MNRRISIIQHFANDPGRTAAPQCTMSSGWPGEHPGVKAVRKRLDLVVCGRCVGAEVAPGSEEVQLDYRRHPRKEDR